MVLRGLLHESCTLLLYLCCFPGAEICGSPPPRIMRGQIPRPHPRPANRPRCLRPLHSGEDRGSGGGAPGVEH